MTQTESQSNEPQRTPPKKPSKAKSGGTAIRTAPVKPKADKQEEQVYAQT